MGLKGFEVVFDSPTNAYYAGTNVTGKVNLTLDSVKKARSLSIKFEGKAEVQWTVQEDVRQNDGQNRSENTTYTGSEEYYSFKYNLVGGGNSEIELPAGTHTYNFTASLPPTLPSSFEGEHGKVRYTATATLDRPWKFDQHTTAVFNVVSPIDLNYNLKAKEPVKQELEKSFCCCWCKSGPLQLVIAMPYAGFVPGQSIPLTIEVDNASNVEVSNVIVELNKILKWKAREPKTLEKMESVELSKLTLEGVEANGSKSWTQMLPIPNMPPLNLDQCTIINCNFILKVTAAVGGCHSNLSGEVPVFIGTVPIYQPSVGQQQPSPIPVPPTAPEAPPPTAPIGFAVDSNGVPNSGLYPSITTPLLPTANTSPVTA
ncbi:arrestin domain-containing protein 3-like [Lycorma delicatula]|uniref:arrestin domain-containing protein 3-like n=1 Tax=Lycorma delicatula TaxID=130591 RepID=UPI003F515E83